jgi:osmotically-inducible protein OsmY
MAEQHRDYEDYRRGGRREWNGRSYEEGPGWGEERSFGEQRRHGRSQDFGGRYSDDGYSTSESGGYGRGPSESGGYGRGPSEFGGRGSFESSGYAGGHGRGREFAGERGYGPRRQEFGGSERGRGMEPDPWQGGPETHSFGGQRTYARDLYSDSGASRHETDWTSGNAGRGMQSVYSGSDWRPERSSFGPAHGSSFGRYQDDAGGARGRYGYAGRGPKDYQRSDERIREEISDRMTDDDTLDASNLTVQVQKGEVTLTGSVTTREQKRRAEDLAEGISGVREVTNSLRVARETEGMDLNQGSIQVGQSSTSATKDLGTRDQGRTKN